MSGTRRGARRAGWPITTAGPCPPALGRDGARRGGALVELQALGGRRARAGGGAAGAGAARRAGRRRQPADLLPAAHARLGRRSAASGRRARASWRSAPAARSAASARAARRKRRSSAATGAAATGCEVTLLVAGTAPLEATDRRQPQRPAAARGRRWCGRGRRPPSRNMCRIRQRRRSAQGAALAIRLRYRPKRKGRGKRLPSPPLRSAIREGSALGGLGLRRRRLGGGRGGLVRTGVAALGDSGGLAGAAAQIIELGAADGAAAHDLDRLDVRANRAGRRARRPRRS